MNVSPVEPDPVESNTSSPPASSRWVRSEHQRLRPSSVATHGLVGYAAVQLAGRLAGMNTPFRDVEVFGYVRGIVSAAPYAAGVYYSSGITPAERHMIIARTAWNSRSRYFFQHHCSLVLRGLGVSQSTIDCLAVGPDADGLTPRLAALVRATDELCDDQMISDHTWAELSEYLDEGQRIGFCQVVGLYLTASVMLNCSGGPLMEEGLWNGPVMSKFIYQWPLRMILNSVTPFARSVTSAPGPLLRWNERMEAGPAPRKKLAHTSEPHRWKSSPERLKSSAFDAFGPPGKLVSAFAAKLVGADTPLQSISVLGLRKRTVAGLALVLYRFNSSRIVPQDDGQLAILRTCWNTGFRYGWEHNSALATEVLGFSQETVDRVALGPEADGWTPRQATILRAADDIFADRFVHDETWLDLCRIFDDSERMGLCTLVGMYMSTAMTMNSGGGPAAESGVWARGWLKSAVGRHSIGQSSDRRKPREADSVGASV